MRNFDSIDQAQPQLLSLDEAEYKTLHTGDTIKREQLSDKETADPEEQPLDKNLAIINKRTKNLSSIVSNRYKLVQHREAFQPLLDAIKKLGIKPDGVIRTFNEGDVATMTIFFPEFNLEKEESPDDSGYYFGLFAMNSYDKTAGFQVHPYAIRLKCSNQFTARNKLEGVESIHRKHFGEMDVVEIVADWLRELKKSRKEFRKVIQEAQQTHFEDIEQVLINAGFPKTKIDGILEHLETNPETEIPTRWDLFNACTAYNTHELEDKNITTERKYDKRASRVLQKPKEELERQQEV